MNKMRWTRRQRVRMTVGVWLIRLGRRIKPDATEVLIAYVPEICDNWFGGQSYMGAILDEAKRMGEANERE